MRAVTSQDGTRIVYDGMGEGPALILVGGATVTRAFQTPLAEELAKNFRVFSYDRRGRGDSGDTLPYAVEREVEDIDALITEAGGTAYVFGHSSGAILALEAARLLPERITKLALYEPPFIIDDSRPPVPRDYVATLKALIAEGKRGEAAEYFMTKAVGMPAEDVAAMRDMPMWGHVESVAHTLIYDGMISAEAMRGTPEPLRKWAGVAVPTLVMDGGASPYFMQHGAEELAKLLPNARHQRLPGQDHGPAGEVLVPALVAFFEE